VCARFRKMMPEGPFARHYQFTGKERDNESGEYGFDMFGARYYGSSLGRFATPDEPLEDQHTSDPQSWNLYSYVRNHPMSWTDPTGRCVFVNGKWMPDDVSDCSEIDDKTHHARDHGDSKYTSSRDLLPRSLSHVYGLLVVLQGDGSRSVQSK
jgi:RHS repeat-associated protein